MSGIAKKLNVQNCENSIGKCTLYVRNVWSCRKIEYSEQCKFNRKLCTLYVRNVCVCRKIECPEQQKFNRKLCTLYMYAMFGLAKKLKA